jgi:hypothetical protein
MTYWTDIGIVVENEPDEIMDQVWAIHYPDEFYYRAMVPTV